MQGAQMTPFKFLGINVGAEQMQSINPVIVMILVPVLTWGVYPRISIVPVVKNRVRMHTMPLQPLNCSTISV